ncbi:sce7725 family protein [Acetobacterium malicum]|uniref:sce7725 family protein n=1 Tax=Acetobacterium malicum TaxID=52692 RepID=UPI000401F462|nr:sce7725 family protein [Acetobacterium dehalogenans]
MYLPYIRGRQYELLALRELVTNDLLGDYVIPIIEPVKLSPTLIKTISEYIRVEHQVAVIRNPIVGSFKKDINEAKNDSKEGVYKKEFQKLYDDNIVIKSIILQKNARSLLNYWDDNGVLKKDLLVINTDRDFLDLFEQEFSNENPCYALIPDESAFRRRIKRNRVILDDKFEKQSRNADYQDIEDEFFSDDHLYFKDDGLKGFADYSVVGNDYQEGGFAPYAVAIHIVYFAKDNSLRIKHFVSDSNEDISNPAKKFYEAVSKLNNWYQSDPFPPTLGLTTLLLHYNNQTYPGLGSVKKLSIMHHLELMGKYLSEGK